MNARWTGLQPWLAPYAEWLYQVALQSGLHPVVTSVYRSKAKQARLYRDYLAGRNRYPVAPPGRSLHEHGLAFDMVVDRGWAPELGRLWLGVGGQWFASDEVHFQVRV